MDSVSTYRACRVAIIGSGSVGSTLAQRIAEKNLADVLLLDVVEGRPQGLALDLLEASGLVGHHRQIVGTNDYAETADSDIVVITAGLPRKPGMSRDDLLQVNGKIVLDVVRQAIAHSPQARFIVVTNPLDVMVYLAWKATGLPSQQVMGMAGVLDSARFQTFIAMALKVPPQDVSAMVLGGHGDLMVPLPQYSTVCGIPVTELLDQATIDRLCDRTRNGGAEIVGLLQKGGAYSAPSAAIYKMVEAILLNQSRILPASAYLRGQYGLEDLYLGVPCRLGWTGIEEILELRLTDAEQALLQDSGDFVKVRTEQVLKQML
ncbi:MAG: malate dehydrogenase [Leptolyngbyaceae cyanobacterium RM1_1_2]|nr:malate dehydrogenase [Leptolyngbyaceae cyanobacterium RM1_1_2]